MATVPEKYDVVINGQGYMTADHEEVKGQYGYTPVFVPRQNTQGDFGDNFQDFWLTFTQRDWTLGEGQKFFRRDDERQRRFWKGTNLDISNEGQISIRLPAESFTAAATVRASCGVRDESDMKLHYATSTNLYSISPDGTITDHGAHGLGAAPYPYGMVGDGNDLFLTTTGSGTVGVRNWTGGAFSTFSATASDSLAFLNNTLYGLSDTGVLRRYDTAGVATTLHSFVSADGGTRQPKSGKMVPFGGDLLILFATSPYGPELWTYDGTGVALTAILPPNFWAWDIEVSLGVIYISGSFLRSNSSSATEVDFRPALYSLNGSTLSLLWRAEDWIESGETSPAELSHPSITSWERGIVLTNSYSGQFSYYDASEGSFSSIAAYTPNTGFSESLLVSNPYFMIHTQRQTTGYRFPANSASGVEDTATIILSLDDYDVSLNKVFRGVKIDYVEGSDGDGGSVDVSYRLNDLEGAYTNLQTGVVSGTEYEFSGVSGRSISIKLTLNKGTSTLGPVVKRVSVRAIPSQAVYRKGTLVLACWGRDGKSPPVLRDGSLEPKDGLALAQALSTAVTSPTPISITDELGTITAVIEAEGFQLRRIRANEFLAVVPYRQV